MINPSIITRTDSYKVTHWKQYPPKTTCVFSYLESRGGMFGETTFFGLQYTLKKYLAGAIVTKEDVENGKKFWTAHFGNEALFNYDGWMRVVNVHCGKLPVVIRAVPEGYTVPVHNALMTVENTDPELPWLTNYIETLLMQTWYPCTVATLSRECKKLILQFLHETGDPSLINFKLHDFGYRGVSSCESAGIGGAAHLVNFMGTDTAEALHLVREYYNMDMAGFSIPATEHSTITSWGREHEFDAYRNVLKQYPTGLAACVSDSYDFINACTHGWGGTLKHAVMGREGTLVVRPDSGYPPDIVVQGLEALGKTIGYETNSKGYKVLDPHVRMIQGDGINYQMISEILTAMKSSRWSTDNIAFGMGGALLQQLNRDTQKFAFKCSSVTIDNKEHDVWKQPATDWSKGSKPGRLKLIFKDGMSMMTCREGEHLANENMLIKVFENGNLLSDTNFSDIRERADVK